MKFSRTFGAAALSAAVVAGVALPATAASPKAAHSASAAHAFRPASPRADADPAACTALATQLVAQLTSAGTGLLAVPPNIGAVTGLVGSLLSDITALQSIGCLPALPPTGTGTPTVCVPNLAQLLSDVFGLLADLTATPPNTTAATTQLTKVLADLTSLINGKCLPAVALPTIPGLPSLPLTSNPLPGPAPTV